MQTSGTTLVAVERHSLLRMWMSAKGSRSAHRLLYLAAVQATGASEPSERFEPTMSKTTTEGTR